VVVEAVVEVEAAEAVVAAAVAAVVLVVAVVVALEAGDRVPLWPRLRSSTCSSIRK
jgi:hypothetical protein